MKRYLFVKSVPSYCAFVGLLSSALIACDIQEPTYPNTPRISFQGFSKYTLAGKSGVGLQKRDSLVITIGFTDGDGNLGDKLPLSSEDITRYQQAGGWGNYKIRTFRLENKQYTEVHAAVDTFLTFPQLTTQARAGAIRGSLDFNQVYYYGTSSIMYPTKYRIQIRDRSLQVSNEIETDTISVPHSY